VHYNELLNFLRAVVSLLSLPSDAGPSAVMAALAKLVEQAARWVLWFLHGARLVLACERCYL
jgi:hypothetical protein